MLTPYCDVPYGMLWSYVANELKFINGKFAGSRNDMNLACKPIYPPVCKLIFTEYFVRQGPDSRRPLLYRPVCRG